MNQVALQQIVVRRVRRKRKGEYSQPAEAEKKMVTLQMPGEGHTYPESKKSQAKREKSRIYHCLHAASLASEL